MHVILLLTATSYCIPRTTLSPTSPQRLRYPRTGSTLVWSLLPWSTLSARQQDYHRYVDYVYVVYYVYLLFIISYISIHLYSLYMYMYTLACCAGQRGPPPQRGPHRPRTRTSILPRPGYHTAVPAPQTDPRETNLHYPTA